MAVFKELANVARAVVVRHARLVGDKALLTSITTGKVCNDFGSQLIGEMIAPLVSRAAVEEGRGGRQRIVITEIPYMVNKASMIEKIADLVRESKIDGISDLRD